MYITPLIAVVTTSLAWAFVPPAATVTSVPPSPSTPGTISGSATLIAVPVSQTNEVRVVLGVSVEGELDRIFVLQTSGLPDEFSARAWTNVTVEFDQTKVLVSGEGTSSVALQLEGLAQPEVEVYEGFGLAVYQVDVDLVDGRVPTEYLEHLGKAPVDLPCYAGGEGASFCEVDCGKGCAVDCIDGYYACCKCGVLVLLPKCECVAY